MSIQQIYFKITAAKPMEKYKMYDNSCFCNLLAKS